ncbi:aldehyde dehydrogenase family protein [Microbacterium sp. X-17]|uniref:aldehyde dehydrogenase family protein n=1 Tax=Microbacterium sp. X-17 TaxID=3144404 RepID=UPI0031F52D3E
MTTPSSILPSAGEADAPFAAASRIAGQWRAPGETVEIRDPYRGDVVGWVPVSTASDGDDALDAARQGAREMAALPGYERAAILRRAAEEVHQRVARIGRVMARETGKAVSDCRTEVARAADTLLLCAEEAVRIQGEHVPMDASPIGAGKIALVMRFPVGVVAAITPFNGPVNLAAHKVGPAFAAGNAVVIKPSPKASLSAHLFVEAIVAAGVPDGAICSLFGDTVSAGLVADPRVDFVSFTGSIPVGKAIQRSMGMKRAALELGGVGPTFVHSDADLGAAAKACARNGYLLAGQSCVSVQNVYVQRSVYRDFLAALEAEIDLIRFGDPLDPTTEVGTLIDETAATRVAGTVGRAVTAGATLLRGGHRERAQLDATLLVDVGSDMDAVKDEIFGPVVTVQAYDDPAPLFRSISESPYGLQCGIFTDSLELAKTAFRSLRTGGVIVNGTSRWRSDQMPYGGVKDSGIGREGPRFAVREMTEERLLVIN